MHPVLMDVQEVASYLNLKPSKIRQMIFCRQIPYLKIGRLVRFRRQEIDSWLDMSCNEIDSPPTSMINNPRRPIFESLSLNSGPPKRRCP